MHIELLISTADLAFIDAGIFSQVKKSIFLGFPHERMVEEVGPGEALPRVLAEQALQEGAQLLGHVGRILHGVPNDAVREGIERVRIKWRQADEKLVQDDAQ